MLRERPGPDSLPCRSLPVHVNGGWPSPETNGPRCPSHRAAIEHVQRDQAPPVVRKRPFTLPLSRPSRTLAGPHSTDLPNGPGFGLESQAQHQAGVAQLVEQRIRNAKVGSSTLFTGTKFQKATLAVAFCFCGPAQSLAAGQPPSHPASFQPWIPHAVSDGSTPTRPSSPALLTSPFQRAECRNLAHPTHPVTRHPPPATQLSNQSQLNIPFHPTQRINQSHLNIQTYPTRTTQSITT